MNRFIQDLIRQKFVLRSMFYVTLNTTVATTRLGFLWWILDPLFLMVTYYFVVKIVFDRGGPDYHLFALAGIVTWQFFSRTVSLGTGALIRNAGLIRQVALPMSIYVVMPVFVQSFCYILGLMIIVIWNYPVAGLHTLALVFPLVVTGLLAFSLSLFLSVFEVYVQDVSKFVTYILRLGFYVSPILYSPSRIYEVEGIPEHLLDFYSLNPMVHIIPAVRNILIDGHMFDWKPMLVILACSLLLVQLGLSFFYKASARVPKEL